MSAFPNTILVGAAKAGTTSLCEDLSKHPDVWMHPTKEPHFFSYHFENGLPYYRKQFNPKNEKVIMEGSPSYTESGNTEKVAKRISQSLAADIKLIYMVRDPVKRLESSYIQNIANGRPPIPFPQALIDWKLFEGSLYLKNYTILSAIFPPENIHVVFFEDYLTRKPQVMDAVADFLSISRSQLLYKERLARNRREVKTIDLPLMKRLREDPFIRKLRQSLPGRAKEQVKALLLPRVKEAAEWTPDVQSFVEEKILSDTSAFLEKFGKPIDYWSIYDHRRT